MKLIPIHDFSKGKPVEDFEIIPWSKRVSTYEVTRPHRHKYYEILFFLRGKGKHEIDFTVHDFKPCSVHFVSASSVHSVSRQPGSAGFSISFAPEFLPHGLQPRNFLFYGPNAFPLMNLTKDQFKSLDPLFNVLNEEYNASYPQKRETLRSLFHVLLIRLQRLYTSSIKVTAVPELKNPIARKLESLIDSHYLNHWRAGDYARSCNTSVTALNAMCRKHFSLTTQQLIQQRLLLEIKRHLAYSDKPVKEICYLMNFEDPAYFNRFFRKSTGLTPAQYRKSIQK